jgi:hypothetical protein
MDKDWKYYLGILLFILSFVPYVIVFCIMPFLSLSAAQYLAASSILLISAEGIFVLSVMLLGKTIIDAIKAAIKTIFKSAFTQHKPISYSRYIIGLVMFFASLIYPTLVIELILFSGDVIFITSFFVLGGEFIAKLKLAFKYHN